MYCASDQVAAFHTFGGVLCSQDSRLKVALDTDDNLKLRCHYSAEARAPPTLAQLSLNFPKQRFFEVLAVRYICR